jgi:hypothetical protein
MDDMEKIESFLKQLGVPSGEWNPAGGNPVHFPFVKSQLETLMKLKEYMSGLAAADTQTVARLREQLTRLQRGGGI